jgi:hypothetical protein
MILLSYLPPQSADYVFHKIMFTPLYASRIKFDMKLVKKLSVYMVYVIFTLELLFRRFFNAPLKHVSWSSDIEPPSEAN